MFFNVINKIFKLFTKTFVIVLKHVDINKNSDRQTQIFGELIISLQTFTLERTLLSS